MAPPSIITPLGIVSVLLNAILAKRVLKEPIFEEQKKGYFFIITGVIMILFSSPKNQVEIGTSVEDVIGFCTSVRFLTGLGCMFIFLAFLIHYSRKGNTKYLLNALVIICSLFGAFSIICTKIFAALLQVNAKQSSNTIQDQLYFMLIPGIISIGLTSTFFQELYKQKSLTHFPVSRFVPLLYAAFNCRFAYLTLVLLFPQYICSPILIL